MRGGSLSPRKTQMSSNGFMVQVARSPKDPKHAPFVQNTHLADRACTKTSASAPTLFTLGPESIACPAVLAMHDSGVKYFWLIRTQGGRIYIADVLDLLCFIDQRLRTLDQMRIQERAEA